MSMHVRGLCLYGKGSNTNVVLLLRRMHHRLYFTLCWSALSFHVLGIYKFDKLRMLLERT